MSIKLGATNTIVLICSSLTMVMAVHASKTNQRKATVMFLVLTMLLGGVFLGIKAIEYYDHITAGEFPGANFHLDENPGLARQAQIFFSLYFAMTGLHALHMIIGIGIVSYITYSAWRGRYSDQYHAPVEITGLYWHFVDIIWIFLFPLLYLISHTH